MNVVSTNLSYIKIGGRKEISPDYGSYETVQGLFTNVMPGSSTLTGKFAKYSLEELNREVRDMGLFGKGVPLLKYVGGTNVGC